MSFKKREYYISNKRYVVKHKKKEVDIARLKIKMLFGETLNEKEKQMIQVYENPKFNKSEKIRIVRKSKPINYIKEDLGNGFELRYFNFSGHCGVYKNSQLVKFIDNSAVRFDKDYFKDCINEPWFLVQLADTVTISTMNTKESLYTAILNEIKHMPKSKRETITIVRWDIPHGKMPKRKNILL